MIFMKCVSKTLVFSKKKILAARQKNSTANRLRNTGLEGDK